MGTVWRTSTTMKITSATVFDVGSIAKQFTAAAILILAHDGKLSLDDPVQKFIPDLPGYAARITLRQLLYHTSGIRDYQQLLWFDGWRLDSPDQVTEGDIYYIISRQKALNFSPGTDFSYSNTNSAASFCPRPGLRFGSQSFGRTSQRMSVNV
jgi:CubicO group peptidase (beta-lactamase class C family)